MSYEIIRSVTRGKYFRPVFLMPERIGMGVILNSGCTGSDPKMDVLLKFKAELDKPAEQKWHGRWDLGSVRVIYDYDISSLFHFLPRLHLKRFQA